MYDRKCFYFRNILRKIDQLWITFSKMGPTRTLFEFQIQLLLLKSVEEIILKASLSPVEGGGAWGGGTSQVAMKHPKHRGWWFNASQM